MPKFNESVLNENSSDEEDVMDRKGFESLLKLNDSVIIIKFGAEWCGPCKTIKSCVKKNLKEISPEIHYYDLDIDESFDLYAYLKSKKMVNGIPVLLAYFKGNTSFASDLCVSGADPGEVTQFFKFCQSYYKKNIENKKL